jgi:hypothetical protein
MKEVFISTRAQRSFHALYLVQAAPDGLLLGHKKGGKFHVENILPTSPGFFHSPDELQALYKLYDETITGFFSYQNKKKFLKNILTPACFGKLFLHIQEGGYKQPFYTAYIIEYEKDFFLLPLSPATGQKRGSYG